MVLTLIDHQFLDYTRVIPENYKYFLNVNKSDMLNALKTILPTTEKTMNHRMKLDIYNNKIVLSSNNASIDLKVNCLNTEKAEVHETIFISCKFLIDGITPLDGAVVNISFVDNSKAVKVSFINQINIIMPMAK